MRWRGRADSYLILSALVLAGLLASLVISWTSFGLEFDKYAYDFLLRAEPPPPWEPSSIILAIDEPTLRQYRGMTHVRTALADGLEKIRGAGPAAVAIDMILAEPGASPEEDARLERAFSATHNLVLASYVLTDGSWEEPIPQFRKHAVAVGHVHANFDKYDSVSRDVPLEYIAGHDRRWALPLEVFRAVHQAGIIESPDDLTVGATRIPASAQTRRLMRIRYSPAPLPRISIAQLDADPQLARRFHSKAVFAGVTAQAAGDRWATPYSNTTAMPGIEMNANEYETLAQKRFLTDPKNLSVIVVCLAIAMAAALIYAFTAGRTANLAALSLVLIPQAIPAVAFHSELVWPWFPGTLTALLTIAISASWRHLLVRRALVQAGDERTRYQKAMQFVTHEMRTPLTAIQGSSELISRYGSMPEAKRQEMAEMINAESKRLARMIETFLSTERLSAGEMQMKQELFALTEVVERCTERARPFADRKDISIDIGTLPAADLTGDRELMEYAVYNLLTNAVKYSAAQTRVKVYGTIGEDGKSDRVRLSIEDQGIGMDKKEVSRIFEKFYRTKRAEQSGEAGTGIGLSIVEQIVTQHGGTIQVESEPGKGSRFTIVLKKAS